MDLSQKHDDIAWSHWLAQFRDGSYVEALVRALLKPADGIQQALRDLLERRWLDTAFGKQLDMIGTIVIMPRPSYYAPSYDYFGFVEDFEALGFDQAPFWDEDNAGASRVLKQLSDERYRRLLYWKIAINNGHGTQPEIVASLKAIFGATRVVVQDAGNAKFRIWMNTMPVPIIPGENAFSAYVPKLAGVGILSFTASGPKPFGFVNQGLYGFGEGVLARAV
ncbi:hypothetical protein ASL20_09625 [Cupriavidus necator]|uniref:DUF2612 domain-containing protein n=1 Tax=Cupriavidus necator TaxID=106590 RepID=UPI000735C8AB|nr:DUF2612 domain-containing protein [Cupriavidus necator]KUE88875.1 hypothetical protein ASL20_09625 [Cupriavidus necator]